MRLEGPRQGLASVGRSAAASRTPATRLEPCPDVAHPPPLWGPCLWPSEPDWLTGPDHQVSGWGRGRLTGICCRLPWEHLGEAVCILPHSALGMKVGSGGSLLDQNPESQPLSPQLSANPSAFGLSVSLSFPSASKWPKEDDTIVTRPVPASPHFSLGKWSRCPLPGSGNPWGLSADKRLHTGRKAGERESGLELWSPTRGRSAVSGDTRGGVPATCGRSPGTQLNFLYRTGRPLPYSQGSRS